MNLSKSDLRTALKHERQSLSEQDAQAKSQKIAASCTELIPWQTIKSLHTYVPVLKENEVDAWHLLEYAWQKYPRIQTVVPRLNKHGKYDSVLVSAATKWRRQGLRIPEPIDGEVLTDGARFDVIVVPMLGFDESGYRLGHGMGWYDKFLITQPQALTIGLCYGFGIVTRGLPKESHDMPLKYIVTEKTTRKTLAD